MTDSRSGPRTKSRYALVVEAASSGSTPGERRAPPARYEIAARETIIGRDPGCAIRIDDAFVSREHARLLLRDLDLHLEDLGSTNETRLDGALVETRVRVRPGSELRLGRAVCRIEGGPLPEERASAAPDGGAGTPKAVEHRAAATRTADPEPAGAGEPRAVDPGPRGRKKPATEPQDPGPEETTRRLGATRLIVLFALVAGLVFLLIAGALWISWR